MTNKTKSTETHVDASTHPQQLSIFSEAATLLRDTPPLLIFIAYSHKDARHLGKLHSHLEILRQQQLAVIWCDLNIAPGGDIDRAVLAKLDEADIFLPLISSWFIQSLYCIDVELTGAASRHADGKCRILPVTLSPVEKGWLQTPIGRLKATPTDAKPIVGWRPQDRAWAVVAGDVRAVVEELLAARGSPSPNPASPIPFDDPISALEPALPAEVSRALLLGSDGRVPFHPARILSELIRYLQSPSASIAERAAQVRNAAALARSHVGTEPALVSSLFAAADKPAKSLGDKKLILDIARISIQASRAVLIRTRDQVCDEARALVCGTSWVYQRVGRLEEAEYDAALSLDLAESCHDPRVIAFCHKCLGRLKRMEAELNDAAVKLQLIDQSVRFLQRAIKEFHRIGDEPEAGDCYSLLGRSYLAAGSIDKAWQAVKQAEARIPSVGDLKDYADLLILKGDLCRAKRDHESAEAWYDEALGTITEESPSASEIRARALAARGRCRIDAEDTSGAAADLANAGEVYSALQEAPSSAQCKWEAEIARGAVPRKALRLLVGQPATVRVKALDIYRKEVASVGAVHVGQRSDPSTERWRRIISDAANHVAIESPQW